MERAVIDFHYDANCTGHDIPTQNTCLILTRNLVLIYVRVFLPLLFSLLPLALVYCSRAACRVRIK